MSTHTCDTCLLLESTIGRMNRCGLKREPTAEEPCWHRDRLTAPKHADDTPDWHERYMAQTERLAECADALVQARYDLWQITKALDTHDAEWTHRHVSKRPYVPDTLRASIAAARAHLPTDAR